MNSNLLSLSLRFVLLLLFQVLILKQFALGWGGTIYVHVFIYPLFFFLLPFNVQRWFAMILAFIMGLLIDMFYNSPGVHTSALVFTVFSRHYVLSWLSPRDGYKVNLTPTKDKMGSPWFFRYASILLLAHLFFYFSVEVFNFRFFGKIILKTLFSYAASIIFIMMIMIIFNPKR